MIHVQIKAKSGLHAGAMWTLDNTFVVLGAQTHADVFLCDPEIPNTLVSLRKNGRKYLIDAMHQEVRLTSSDQRPVDRVLFPAQVITLDFRHIQLEIEILNGSAGVMASMADGVNRWVYELAMFLRNIGARAIIALLFLVGFLLTILIVFYGTAGGVSVQASELRKPAPGVDMSLKSPEIPLNHRMALVVGNQLSDFANEIKTKNMKISVKDTHVDLTAELSRVQTAGLEKTLVRLANDYGRFVSIKAILKFTPEQKLVDSIQVEQVVLGKQPVVVLRDGSRLYLGGNFHDVRLVGIDADRIVFKGDTTYEVLL